MEGITLNRVTVTSKASLRQMYYLASTFRLAYSTEVSFRLGVFFVSLFDFKKGEYFSVD